VCVVSTISSYDISAVDWSSVHKRDIPWCVCVLSVLYPRMTSPQLIGPLYTKVTYLGAGPFVDFYFICRVSCQQSDDNQAGFEVVLTFNSTLSNVIKTATSSSLDVVFTSRDTSAGFGTQVVFTSLMTHDFNFPICMQLSYGEYVTKRQRVRPKRELLASVKMILR